MNYELLSCDGTVCLVSPVKRIVMICVWNTGRLVIVDRQLDSKNHVLLSC